MRNFLCLAAAFALSTTVPATPTADACGGSYGVFERAPRAYAVSTHFIPRARGADGHRAFVALGGTAPDGLAWKQLAPMSYDATRIAPAPAGGPMTLTLVGEKGTRVITSARYVYLSQSMFMAGSTLALEFDIQQGDDFEVALFGTHAGVKWSSLSARTSSKADVAWLRGRGLGVAKDDSATVYKHGDLEALSIYDEKSREIVTVLRRGNTEIGRHFGWSRGIVEVSGTRYVAMTYKRNVSLVAF